MTMGIAYAVVLRVGHGFCGTDSGCTATRRRRLLRTEVRYAISLRDPSVLPILSSFAAYAMRLRYMLTRYAYALVMLSAVLMYSYQAEAKAVAARPQLEAFLGADSLRYVRSAKSCCMEDLAV